MMKLKFQTEGLTPQLKKDQTYKLVPTIAVLGTFGKVRFEDLKKFVKKFDRAWVEV